jgi:hypothetical protein
VDFVIEWINNTFFLILTDCAVKTKKTNHN